jgi:hypothetical protein
MNSQAYIVILSTAIAEHLKCFWVMNRKTKSNAVYLIPMLQNHFSR